MTVVSPSTLSHAALTEVAATRADWTDGAALALFVALWAGYPYLTQWLGRRRGAINLDMTAIRLAWMRAMARYPDRRLLDGQLLGHTLNTATFFASTNLILIAAVAGALFGGERTYRAILDIPLLSHGPRLLFEFKLILVLLTLAGGLFDYIWAIRQLGYCLTLTGAAPQDLRPADSDRYARASGQIFDHAIRSYNAGVRAYYFALAASAWLIQPLAFALSVVGAVALLLARQMVSPTARAVREARAVIDGADQADRPTPIGQETPVPPIPQ